LSTFCQDESAAPASRASDAHLAKPIDIAALEQIL
jgi:hypothetical protein